MRSLLSFPRGIAKSRIRRFLSKLLDPLGEERIRLLVEHQAHFHDLIRQEQWERWRQQARPYRGYARLLSNDDFYQCVSGPVRSILESSPEGKTWLSKEITWLRSYLVEDNDDATQV